MVCLVSALVAGASFVRAAAEVSAWTNVAGNVIVGEVVSADAASVTLVTGAAAQKRVPAVIAPAWNEFAAKCAAKTATRGDLIALKRFIAVSAIDDAAKKAWTQKARKAYQGMRAVKVER